MNENVIENVDYFALKKQKRTENWKSHTLQAAGSSADVTNTGNGERGTGNGEPGTGVWELMYSGNPLENSKWRSKQKKRSKRNNFG